MAGMSDATELNVLAHIVAKTSYTMPTSPLYLALTTVAVSDTDTAGSLTEAAYTGYARLSVAGTAWGTPSAGQIANSSALTFAACTSGTSTVVGWALVTTSSGAGAIQVYGAFSPSLVVSTTQTPVSFAIGALVVTAD